MTKYERNLFQEQRQGTSHGTHTATHTTSKLTCFLITPYHDVSAIGKEPLPVFKVSNVSAVTAVVTASLVLWSLILTFFCFFFFFLSCTEKILLQNNPSLMSVRTYYFVGGGGVFKPISPPLETLNPAVIPFTSVSGVQLVFISWQ